MGADRGGNLASGLFYSLCKLVKGTAHFTGLCLCSRLYIGGDTGNPFRTDPDSRPFKRLSERRDCGRLAHAHALEQQFRLAVE